VSVSRDVVEAQIVADVQALSAASDDLSRVFRDRNDLTDNDFRALLHVMVSERDGEPLTQSQLGRRIGVSGAAITYLVDRMVQSGHLTREQHPSDRRKVLLRYADHPNAVARAFFTPLGQHTAASLAQFSATELATAHRVLEALVGSMREFGAELEG